MQSDGFLNTNYLNSPITYEHGSAAYGLRHMLSSSYSSARQGLLTAHHFPICLNLRHSSVLRYFSQRPLRSSQSRKKKAMRRLPRSICISKTLSALRSTGHAAGLHSVFRLRDTEKRHTSFFPRASTKYSHPGVEISLCFSGLPALSDIITAVMHVVLDIKRSCAIVP